MFHLQTGRMGGCHPWRWLIAALPLIVESPLQSKLEAGGGPKRALHGIANTPTHTHSQAWSFEACAVAPELQLQISSGRLSAVTCMKTNADGKVQLNQVPTPGLAQQPHTSQQSSSRLLWTMLPWAVVALVCMLGKQAKRWACRRRRRGSDAPKSKSEEAVRSAVRGSGAQLTLPAVTWHEGSAPEAREVLSDRSRQKRRGDGNCFWRCLGGARWKALKRTVRSAHDEGLLRVTPAQRQELQQAMKAHQWVSEAVIRAVAAVHDIEVQVYCRQVGSSSWRRAATVGSGASATRIVRVALHDCHYDRLKGGWHFKRTNQEQSNTDEAVGASKGATRPPTPGKKSVAAPSTAASKEHRCARRKEQKTASGLKQTRSQEGRQESMPPPCDCCGCRCAAYTMLRADLT